MFGLPYTLLTVAGLLVVIGLLQPLAVRLNLSPTVLLAVVGVFIGSAAGFLLHTDLTDAFNEVAELILDFPISSTEVLYIFLPILLFEAAITIDVRRMLEDAAPIFLLAVIAVLVATAVVGLALWPVAGMSLVVCLLLAAIVATTDPAAVVAIFRDLGAPGRLTRLVEGESLLNDATAIADLHRAARDPDGRPRARPSARPWARSSHSFLGGALVGFVGGRALMMVVPWLRDSRLAEMTLTLALPYIVYILSRALLRCLGRDRRGHRGAGGERARPPALRPGQPRLPAGRLGAAGVLGQLAGVRPGVDPGAAPDDRHPALRPPADRHRGARARWSRARWCCSASCRCFSAARLAQRVSHRYKFVIIWGGLRGAVTLALALGVTENRAIDPEIQRFVAILATGFVLFTLLVNGTTLRPMIRLLGSTGCRRSIRRCAIRSWRCP